LRYVDIAHQESAQMQPMMAQYPLGFGQWLQALVYALSKPREIAIQVVTLGAPDPDETGAPLLRDHELVGERAAAYVCRAFAYLAPVTGPEGLLAEPGQGDSIGTASMPRSAGVAWPSSTEATTPSGAARSGQDPLQDHAG